MAGDARLRLAQDFCEVRNGEFGFGQKREDAQARALGHRPQRVVHRFEGQRTGHQQRSAFGRGPTRYKDIFIR
jgi:hypothetical protein